MKRRHGALRMPAANPFVIAVGALDTNNTNITGDDFITLFTKCGGATPDDRRRSSGSFDPQPPHPEFESGLEHSDTRVDDRLFWGTGTSQAAVVVSGAVGLMIDQRPDLSPDLEKALLVRGFLVRGFLVRGIVERGELEFKELVRGIVERRLVVGGVLERRLVVGSFLERLRVVGAELALTTRERSTHSGSNTVPIAVGGSPANTARKAGNRSVSLRNQSL